MADVILWTDDSGSVVAYTPPAPLSAQHALASNDVPKDRPTFIADNATLPSADIRTWVLGEDGTVTVDASRYAPVPQVATSGDFVAALSDLGWYADVDAAANAAGGKALALWKHASAFESNHPMVISIAQAIGKTDADLDELFRKTTTYA